MSLLDRLVRRIHDRHCRFRLSDDKVKDIEDMVLNLVKVLLPTRLRNSPGCRYSIKEVINAGSYFEQTKIELPNEFDFMLVVDQLSSEDSIFVSQGCRPGYAHVGVTEPHLWDSASSNDGPERRFEIAMLQFNMYVRESLKHLLLEPLRGRFGQLRIKETVVRGKPFKAFSHVQTLTLLWSEFRCADIVDPATNVLYERQPVDHKEKDLEICVDLMTCCHLPLSTFKNILPETCFENEALDANGCHVVLKSCESSSCVERQRECRLISYTKTEQECMRGLDVSWKVAYRMLKWLFRYTEILEVDTYKIKTAVLYCSSRGHGEVIPVGEELIAILQVLRDSALSDKLPGYFNPSLNIWSVSPCYHYLVKYEMIFLLKLFTNIHSRSDEGRDTDLDKYLNVINSWIYSFCSRDRVADMSKMKENRASRLEQFNCQGNVFLDILKDLEPALKTNPALSWIPFQLKCHVLADVFKVLSSVFVEKVVLFLDSIL